MPKTALKNKMVAHNKKSKHKVTMRMLEAVYDRGVGAYRTNPQSVRPNVTGPEQWAMARVNSFLKIVTGLRRLITTKICYRQVILPVVRSQ